MQIQKLSTSDYNINCKGTKEFTKRTIGAISAGIAITLGKNKTDSTNIEDDLNYEDLSDVKEIDDNIFDEEYYQAYYNIDLNLAKNRAFRDNELFNPLRDNERVGYQMYDDEDIRIADNLNYKTEINEYTTKYKLSDTDFGDLDMPDAVAHPHKPNDDLKIIERYVELNKRIKELKITDFIKEIILGTCKRNTEGFYEVDFELVKVALDLYANDKTWFGKMGEATEIINILKHYDTDSDEYNYLYNYIQAGIHARQSNYKIYHQIFKKSKQFNLQ